MITFINPITVNASVYSPMSPSQPSQNATYPLRPQGREDVIDFADYTAKAIPPRELNPRAFDPKSNVPVLKAMANLEAVLSEVDRAEQRVNVLLERFSVSSPDKVIPEYNR